MQDFHVFHSAIDSKEGTLDLNTSKEDLNKVFVRLRIQLSTERTLSEQFKYFSEAISDIGCGHTQIHPNKETLRDWLSERNSLPIDYFLYGKKLIVNRTDPADHPMIYEGKSIHERKKRLSEGTEIIRINGKSVEEMMEGIGQLLSSDEDDMSFKYFQAAHLFEFYRHLSDPFNQDSIRVDYLRSNDTLSIYFQTGTAPVNTMNKRLLDYADEVDQEEYNIGEFKVIKSKYGYFRFTSFTACYGKEYNDFLEDAFKQIRNRKIKKLVVDLRGNTGGVMQYELMRYFVGGDQYLGRYIVAKPHHLGDSKYVKKLNGDYLKHFFLSQKQKRLQRNGKFDDGRILSDPIDEEKVFKGDVIVITDEGTFSSAAILASHLKTLCNAKIAGQSAGGSFYSGNSGTLQVRLPQSGLKLLVNPNTFYSHLEKPSDPISIKQPDLIVQPPYLKGYKLDAYYFKQAVSLFD